MHRMRLGTMTTDDHADLRARIVPGPDVEDTQLYRTNAAADAVNEFHMENECQGPPTAHGVCVVVRHVSSQLYVTSSVICVCR